ncbi:MAG: hypothetical protein HYU28_01380 [Actinobacteria bacterium]|nr:hypothetical protein [Actinomycetota bacterium]
MQCEDVRGILPSVGDDNAVDLRAQRHIETCLGCQAEVARYQRMVRALGSLRELHFEAPDGLLEETLAAIGGPSVIRVLSGRQKAAIAGTIGAVAAGAAATAVVLARRRGGRLATVLAR